MSGIWGSAVLSTAHRLISDLCPQIQVTWLTPKASAAALSS
jgi:hypothetical protein